jgi:hypothetical protein
MKKVVQKFGYVKNYSDLCTVIDWRLHFDPLTVQKLGASILQPALDRNYLE